MSEATGTDGTFEVRVQLHGGDLYWYFLKVFTSFPMLALLMVPIVGLACYDAVAGENFYNAVGLVVFILILLPWGSILLGYRNTLLKNPVRYVFSNSGVSSVMHPVSSFVEWSWAKGATENRRYILITLRNGFVLLPKNQLTSDEIASVRTLVQKHLNQKAHLAASN